MKIIEPSRFFLPLAVALFALPQTAAAAAPTPQQAINAEIDALTKKKTPYREIVEQLERRLAEDDVRTNAALRVYIDQKILAHCTMPSWIRLGLWDKAWSDQHLPAVCQREIEAEDCPNGAKLEFLRALARHQAGAKDLAAARETAERALKLKALNRGELFKAHCLVADYWKWADVYVLAKDVYLEAAKIDLVGAAKELATLAEDFGKTKEIEEAWQGIDDPYPRLAWYYDHDRAAVAEDALAYVGDKAQPEKKRREILIRYFGTEKSERAAAARTFARELDYAGYMDWRVNKDFENVYRFGDWSFFVELAETFKTWPWFQDPNRVRGYFFSLVAIGRAAEVPALVDDFLAKDAAKEKGALKPFERFRFTLLKALAEGKDLLAVIEAERLEVKEKAQAVQIAAQWTLNLQRNDDCERYAAAYKALFKQIPERRYGIRFFARPIASIDAWRAVADSLETSYVDVKMCGALDQLETDVATGRKEVEKTALDSKDARMAVQAFCDVEGLKLVLRVADPNARAVEAGFAGGMGTECYFAPGTGEPYVCFGSTPKEGLGFVFYTAYSSAAAERVEFDDLKSPNAIRQETAFTDNDYVLMLTLPWRAFYQKLPAAAGTEWRFECMADGYSWGGSQGIHEASSWGHLVFDLKPEEIAAIRRRLVYDTYKQWNARSHEKLPAFDRWADPVVGDPAFHEKVLKPLEAKLKAEAAKVKPVMTDAEVNEVYENGARIWIGLDHEIDALRRQWLLDTFTTESPSLPISVPLFVETSVKP